MDLLFVKSLFFFLPAITELRIMYKREVVGRFIGSDDDDDDEHNILIACFPTDFRSELQQEKEMHIILLIAGEHPKVPCKCASACGSV